MKIENEIKNHEDITMFTQDEQAILRSIPISFEWIARDVAGRLCVYEDKPDRVGIEFSCNSNTPTKFANLKIFKDIFKGVTWENSPIKFRGGVLDKVERKYLKAVFKPFRNTIVSVEKRDEAPGLQYIQAELENGEGMVFPSFEDETMYKGMISNKKYSLSELGIKYD